MAPDSVPRGGTINVAVTVTSFTLEEPAGPNQQGHGHYALYLDDATGDCEVVGFDGTETISIATGTQLGAPAFRVEVQNDDFTPLDPPVETTAPFTVTP